MKNSCIRRLRIALLWHQNKFAQEMGVSRGAVCQWESGARSPNFYHIQNMIDLAKKNGIKFNHSELIDKD